MDSGAKATGKPPLILCESVSDALVLLQTFPMHHVAIKESIPVRHAFGTEAVAAGTDIGTVANLMGQSTPTMLLKHYQYVMDKQKRAAVELLPDLRYVPTSMCPQENPSQGVSVRG